MAEKNALIVDAHSLGYYQQEAEVTLVANDMQTQSVFGFIKAVRRQSTLHNAQPIIMWDGAPIHRKALFPEYKVPSGKPNERLVEMREHFKKQKPYIRAMMSALGVHQYVANDGEADDLGAMFCRENYDKYDHIYLYSGDSDWIQLVNDKVSFINVRDKKSTPEKPQFRIIDKDCFVEATGYKDAIQFVQAKALVGEKSDSVPGVGGIGDAGAKELLLEYGSVGQFVKKMRSGEIHIEKGRYKKPFEALANNAFNEKSNGRMLDIFKRNMRLILLQNSEMFPQDIEHIEPNFSQDKFEKLCRKLAFMSILEDIDAFVSRFERYVDK